MKNAVGARGSAQNFALLRKEGRGRSRQHRAGRRRGRHRQDLALAEFARRADKDCRVLWGWCEALFTPRPLGPLKDMARRSTRRAALLDQTAAPERLFPALLNTLQSGGTTVLVFEDVHWADNATLDLVKYLGRRISLCAPCSSSARAAMKSARSSPGHVLGDLPRSGDPHDTRSLSPEPSRTWPSSGSRWADLYRITDGNPFFVTELLASSETSPGKFPTRSATRCGRDCRA